MAEVLTLAGRTFRPVQHATFAQDLWMMEHAHAAGLDAGGVEVSMLVARIFASGRVPQFLAGTLVEDGIPWTPESAAAAATFFAGLTDPAEKAQLHEVLTGLILGFFVGARRSPETSPSSSGPPTPAPETATPPAASGRTRSGRGKRSSAPAPITTPSASPP